MKKKLFKFLIIFTFTFSYAQKSVNYQGSVLYRASLNAPKISKKIPKKIQTAILQTMKNSKDLNCSLIFKEGKSLFFIDKRLKIGNKNSINLTEILIGKGIYYSDKNSLLLQKESLGETFLISLPSVKWKITQEKKKIGKYICYKATTEKKVENRTGKFTKKIVAWYTPQIPLNLGPKDYIGLPGLIIQLQEGKLMFYANKISLNTITRVPIKQPIKGKKITLNKYENLIKNIYGKK